MWSSTRGDGKELAVIKNDGRLILTKIETLEKDVPRNMQMIDEILDSTWPVVSTANRKEATPGVQAKLCRAQAILVNPVTYGHVHEAKHIVALLHYHGPAAVPTTALPHLMSNLAHHDEPQRKTHRRLQLRERPSPCQSQRDVAVARICLADFSNLHRPQTPELV
ncbi:unnamed protein product [Phytophthora fragariaefolia]|uniref:Unnamed protein product n=1 Tax=Phytophthora fragariaefolia TaxID=1490495 RepID=A0A9W6XZL7_9STRA|nr:unnamed protein product [Phytophthora fragariaefolia]